MADIQLDTEANPATPSSGSGILLFNSTNKELTTVDDAGNVRLVRTLTNANNADVVASAADTYLTGSAITVPPQLVRVGSRFRWQFAMSKTGAGTATPIWSVRIGTAGTVSDTARLTFTGVAQTANADNGWAEIDVIVRTIGASGVIAGVYNITKASSSSTLGLTNQQSDVKQVTSSTFDLTVPNLIFGVSCNPGASGVWTFQHVGVQATNL